MEPVYLPISTHTPPVGMLTLDRYVSAHLLPRGLQLGGFAGTSFGNGSLFESYVAPHLSIPVSQRLRLNTGVMVTNGFGNFAAPNPENTGTTMQTARFMQTSLFVQGQYKISDKLTFSGMAMYSLNNYPAFTDVPMSSFQYNKLDWSMGMEYKLGGNTAIGFQVSTFDPYRSQSRMFNSPLSPPPFRRW